MSVDVYRPCPCDNGKKIKFCCASVVDQLIRAEELLADHQLRAAQKELESALKKRPESAWGYFNLGRLHMDEYQYAAATKAFEKAIELSPDYLIAYRILVGLKISLEGYSASRRLLGKFFIKCSKKANPDAHAVAQLLVKVFSDQGRAFQAREAAALALRSSPREDFQESFSRLARIDADSTIPACLRGPNSLAEFVGTAEETKEARKAHKLAVIGVWDVAADTYAALSANHPENAGLLRNVALCKAWAGEMAQAGEWMLKAAQAHPTLVAQVEAYLLALWLSPEDPQQIASVVSRSATPESVGRILTLLDESPRFEREHEAPVKNQGDVVFTVFDRDWASGSAVTSLAESPRTLGSILFSGLNNPNAPAQMFTRSRGNKAADALYEVFNQVAPGLVTWSPEGAHVEVATPADFTMEYLEPETVRGMSPAAFLNIGREFVRTEVLPALIAAPRALLGGRSLLQAKDDQSEHGKVYALAYGVASAITASHLDDVGVGDVLQLLDLPPLPEFVTGPNDSLSAFSNFQLGLITIEQVSDDQLKTIVNRVSMEGSRRLVKRALLEAVRRPDVVTYLSPRQLYGKLADLAVAEQNISEALGYCETMREHAAAVADANDRFMHEASAALLEFTIRLHEPANAQTKVYIAEILQKYRNKFPNFREHLLQQATELGLVEDQLRELFPEPGMTAGGLWTPDQGEPVLAGSATGGEPGKLWLPGT